MGNRAIAPPPLLVCVQWNNCPRSTDVRIMRGLVGRFFALAKAQIKCSSITEGFIWFLLLYAFGNSEQAQNLPHPPPPFPEQPHCMVARGSFNPITFSPSPLLSVSRQGGGGQKEEGGRGDKIQQRVRPHPHFSRKCSLEKEKSPYLQQIRPKEFPPFFAAKEKRRGRCNFLFLRTMTVPLCARC